MRAIETVVLSLLPFLGFSPVSAHGPSEPLSWDNLESRIAAEAEHGFAGVIVVVRDGKPVIEEAVGAAAKGVPNRMDTIFAIGSTPIDFTHVGILLLVDEGKLALSDPITKFFDDVPADKRAITVEHLMTGASGLQNFHGDPEKDGNNPDHPWIDRDEAMRRIFAQKLLFEPGTGDEHSHSAWGVLAAILEIVSGKSYEEFTTERIYRPLGMKDTGFFGQPYPAERMAVGTGALSHGEVNAPPYWGRTSWLVMGSGGQVSTVHDMLRFVRGMNEGELLSEKSSERFLSQWGGGVLAGGDAFGFEVMYTTDPANMMILMSNDNPPDRVRENVGFAEELARLTLGRPAARFSLGVRLAIGPEGLTVAEAIEGGAAARDGLRAGDRLRGIGGTTFDGDPRPLLDPYLQSGDAIPFDVEREGTTLRVVVKPDPR